LSVKDKDKDLSSKDQDQDFKFALKDSVFDTLTLERFAFTEMTFKVSVKVNDTVRRIRTTSY